MWKGQDQMEETDQDDDDSCNTDVCNDLHKVEGSCCYQNFDDNANCTDKSQDWISEHEPGKYQDCPND